MIQLVWNREVVKQYRSDVYYRSDSNELVHCDLKKALVLAKSGSKDVNSICRVVATGVE